ncbi:hypothetical protein Naga_101087g1 [Nannochloropsis gaditana]|uniref:Uncharacterized protein n=1 Tax=Nannochloropsis gaditana TaxID=72520 RepID=W7TSE4_9STRA|nr:hypothetical protein Naga_101087g1 [Nannochloropsis gaditana]
MCLELALSGRGILFLILFLPSVPSEMATEMARSPALHPPSPPPLPQQCRQQQQRQEPEYFRSRVSYGRMIRRTWQPAWQSAPNSWSRPCLLIASGFCTALGVGYQAVAIAGWLQYYLLLRFLDRGRRRLRLWVLAWLVHAAGWTLAMAVGR